MSRKTVSVRQLRPLFPASPEIIERIIFERPEMWGRTISLAQMSAEVLGNEPSQMDLFVADTKWTTDDASMVNQDGKLALDTQE